MEQLKDLLSCHGSTALDGRFALSGSQAHYAPDRTLDTRHLRLELVLNIPQQSLAGTATATLASLTEEAREVIFDAVDFRNVQVSSPQRRVKHTYDGRKLVVRWDEPVRHGQKIDIVIRYRITKPKLGLYFILPDRQYPSKPKQVWSQGEDEYNRYWFPCHDAPQERMTTETLITVPEKYTAVSNGGLVKVTHNTRGKTKLWHWKQNVPHSPYLVSIAVGEFTEIRDKWKNVPVLYYVTPGQEEDAKRAFGKTPAMMEFFSSKLGVPYAYAKYSQVAAVDFIYGGMENTSSTTQTSMTLHDERAHLDFSSDPLVAHELAHQWFGDLVTCRDWSHAWLNESFATYFEALFKEHDMGYDEFVYELYGNAQAYFDEDKDRYRRPMVTHTYKQANDMFDRHLYEKGSLILHMLRRILGDAAWWRSMNVYLSRHKTQNVETIDLINAIQDATGRNMRPFFDQWIYKGGHPEYKVRSWYDAAEKKVFVRVLQTHGLSSETGLFSAPITLRFYIDGKRVQDHVETIDKKEHLFSYPFAQPPLLVLFDPEHHVLKRVDFVKPEAMWILQLRMDTHVLGRLQAAQVLGRSASPAAIKALSDALQSENFWGTAGEIARALGNCGTPAAMEALIDGLHRVTHPKTRRAIYEALGKYRHPLVVAELRKFASEKSYFAEAEAIRSLGRMKDVSLLEVFKGLLLRESWNDVIRCAALDAIGSLQLPESVEILKRYTAWGHHQNARMTAIRVLGSLAPGRDDIQKHLMTLVADRYLLVQLSAARALAYSADERAVEALLPFVTGDYDGRLKRTVEETIRKIRRGMDPELPEAVKKPKK